MKKLLLVNPPYKIAIMRDYYCGHKIKGDYYWTPVDLLMLSRLDNFEIKVIDFIVEKKTEEMIENAIAFSPDVIRCDYRFGLGKNF
ncbi:MAG: hypothetical protein ABH832_04520 [bacterium]